MDTCARAISAALGELHTRYNERGQVTTSHMVVSNYDSFLDPRTWPDAEEIERLRAIYGWSAVEDRSVVAPLGHPLGARDGAREDVCPEVTETPRSSGTPGAYPAPPVPPRYSIRLC